MIMELTELNVVTQTYKPWNLANGHRAIRLRGGEGAAQDSSVGKGSFLPMTQAYPVKSELQKNWEAEGDCQLHKLSLT